MALNVYNKENSGFILVLQEFALMAIVVLDAVSYISVRLFIVGPIYTPIFIKTSVDSTSWSEWAE